MAEHIEREKVLKLLNNNIGNTAVEAAVNGHSEEYFDGWTDATSSAIMGIESIPAADVRPEKHGRWLEYDGYQVCSECGEEHAWDSYRATYCEDCGAKMDGKDV